MFNTDGSRTGNTAALALVLAAALGVSGCPQKDIPAPKIIDFPDPHLPIQPARSTITPKSQFMRVAVLNFVDQTGKAGAAVEPLADMLSTELHKSGRFEVYDRGHLRYFDATQVIDQCQKSRKGCVSWMTQPAEKGKTEQASAVAGVDQFRAKFTADAYNAILNGTDAVLLGAVTAVSEKRMDFDFRLVNSFSFTTMVSGTGSVSYESSGAVLRLGRDEVVKTAADIRAALPTPSAGKIGKVTVQDGRVLTVSLGRKDGIIQGMNVFVVMPGRAMYTQAGTPVLVDELYLAQAYVVSVYENSSQVVVFDGSDYRVGDDVRFK
jgi:curli biogenesis system outer membrane secretion channel CsgG